MATQKLRLGGGSVESRPAHERGASLNRGLAAFAAAAVIVVAGVIAADAIAPTGGGADTGPVPGEPVAGFYQHRDGGRVRLPEPGPRRGDARPSSSSSPSKGAVDGRPAAELERRR